MVKPPSYSEKRFKLLILTAGDCLISEGSQHVMNIEISLMRVKERHIWLLMRDDICVLPWFQELDVTVNFLVRIILDAKLGHFLGVGDLGPLIAQHPENGRLPVLFIVLLFGHLD